MPKPAEPKPVTAEESARVPNVDVGNTRELRERERLRGDKGGGPREDGVPDVPHGTDGHDLDADSD